MPSATIENSWATSCALASWKLQSPKSHPETRRSQVRWAHRLLSRAEGENGCCFHVLLDPRLQEFRTVWGSGSLSTLNIRKPQSRHGLPAGSVHHASSGDVSAAFQWISSGGGEGG